jgi:serine/threonine protein kinase
MHIKITDFGTAKILPPPGNQDEKSSILRRDSNHERQTTFVGTAQYVSPEMLHNQEINESVDLWALGCLVYEFLTGKHPFTGESEYLIFQNIKSKNITFPCNFPPVAKDLVNKLLVLDPQDRLGVGPGGYAKLKAHPFFKGIKFDKLHMLEPPMVVPLCDRPLPPRHRATLSEIEIQEERIKTFVEWHRKASFGALLTPQERRKKSIDDLISRKEQERKVRKELKELEELEKKEIEEMKEQKQSPGAIPILLSPSGPQDDSTEITPPNSPGKTRKLIKYFENKQK